MSHFLKIADGIDVKPLLSQIDAHPELWGEFNMRAEVAGTPHARMSDIWVRYNDIKPFIPSGDWATFNDPHVPIWYPAWKKLPALRPIVFDLLHQVEGEMLGGVLITRIPSGASILPHQDDGWHVQYYEKFYLSLRSAPGATFWAQAGAARQGINPAPGEIYLFDNRKRHWVENHSDEDRITLIICVRTAMFGRY